ncbi:MAG TPA: CmcI family methyltransferase, partial [Pseudoxanthomonas sp.]|nr:CmcI family methyltransferase [Pseudoxanthomonas sp.]
GLCAFSVRFADVSLIGEPMTVRVRTQYDVFELPGSPLPGKVDSSAGALSLMPIALIGPGIVGYLDLCGLGKARGWAVRTNDSSDAVQLAFHESGELVLRADAHLWRNDLADMRQGNGSCGFETEIPAELSDGGIHEWDIRDAETGMSLVERLVKVVLEPPVLRALGKPANSHEVPALQRDAPSDTLQLSVVVNFYNMHREAARTLTSLTRAYQRGVEGLQYEVLCVDNGSDPPLQEEWIEAFGPEFRLLRPRQVQASPCAAINDAVRHARGRYVAVMIDGAHVLTPGVFSEAMAAMEEDPEAIVAVRHWFVGGDQRWLSMAGYSRELEDKLFTRIHWPSDGYQLFHIGAPIGEHADPWLVGMIESNCLFLPTTFYCEIGGMDEAFSEPGAGFANLDLFQRAGLAAPDGIVSLVGEASFHQYHGGTTTNVSDDEKDIRVRAYSNKYAELRGEDFVGIEPAQMKLRGVIHDKSAMGARQRPLLPMKLGITPRVRPGVLEQHFDEGSRLYLQSAYAESGLHQTTTWQGTRVALAPTDLLNLQEIIFQQRPDHIITNSQDDGLPVFLDRVLASLGMAQSGVTRVLAEAPAGLPVPARTHDLVGAIGDIAVLEQLARRVGDAESVLVLFAPSAGEVAEAVLEMQAYAQFVSYRSYLVFLGSVFGQPWLGYSSNWHLSAIRRFVSGTGFVIDDSWTRHWLTTCPSGYLRKVDGRTSAAAYDDSLDNLDEFLGAS